MRGIILAGGRGSRLGELTKVNNKHLLPIYDKPMCFYPIETLVKAGITELAIVVSGIHAGKFVELLGNGTKLGLKSVTYLVQEKDDGGIADALSLAEDFAKGEKIAVMLGDNTMDTDMEQHIKTFHYYYNGAMIFLKEVDHPEKFGVPSFDDKQVITTITEKPKEPASDYAVIGLYLYDHNIFDYIRKCKPSERGQLEISDCNNMYLQNKQLQYRIVDCFWTDAGEPDSLFKANEYWYNKTHSKASEIPKNSTISL